MRYQQSVSKSLFPKGLRVENGLQLVSDDKGSRARRGKVHRTGSRIESKQIPLHLIRHRGSGSLFYRMASEPAAIPGWFRSVADNLSYDAVTLPSSGTNPRERERGLHV